METTSAKVRAVGFSLSLHVLLAFILYRGLLTQPEISNAVGDGPAIEATLVTVPQQGPTMTVHHRTEARAKPPTPQPPTPQPPTPSPVEQPQPQQRLSQSQVPKPDSVDQDEIRRTAQLAAEQQQKEQDERRRQAQIDLDRKQQQLQAENRQRQIQADLQKQMELIRKQRADADRQVKLEAEKLKQIEDRKQALARNATPAGPPAVAPAAAGSNGQDARGRYVQAIRDVVNQNWHHDGVPERTHCEVHFKQLRGGEVFQVSFGNCPFDAGSRASVEDALKRTPLPYAGFENVFTREGTIDLCYPEEACK